MSLKSLHIAKGAGSRSMKACCLSVVLAIATSAVGCTRAVDLAEQARLVGAILRGDAAGLEHALEAGARINEEWGLMSPLGWAAEGGHVQAAELLISRGAAVNAHFGLPRRTALQQAAEAGHLDVLAYLVKAGADLNARNKFGRTALYHARKSRAETPQRREQVIEYLRSNGALE